MRRAVLVALVCAAAPLAAQEPTLGVIMDGAVARIQATDLLADGKFVDLLRSGFPLRLHYRLELWRVRSNWFDQFVNTVEWDAVARYDPLAEEYLLLRTGGGITHLTEAADLAAALAIPYRVTLPRRRDGRFYAVCRLAVTTLDDSDLQELSRWLRGDVGPAMAGDETAGQALTRGAQRALVRIAGLPETTLEARSRVFTFPVAR